MLPVELIQSFPIQMKLELIVNTGKYINQIRNFDKFEL